MELQQSFLSIEKITTYFHHINKQTSISLTELWNNVVETRYSCSVTLLCISRAFHLCCVIQLIETKNKKYANIKFQSVSIFGNSLTWPISPYHLITKYFGYRRQVKLTSAMFWKSFPVRSLSCFFSSFGFAAMIVLRSKRRYSDFKRRSFCTYGHAFLSMNSLTFTISFADSFARAAASVGVNGWRKNRFFNGKSRSLASSEFSVPAANTHFVNSTVLRFFSYKLNLFFHDNK